VEVLGGSSRAPRRADALGQSGPAGEKTFLSRTRHPDRAVLPSVDSLGELEVAPSGARPPSVLKTRRFGYDGKGQVLREGADTARLPGL
jgi:phosphoribosylaminoimidazole carboxylase (NCAIR synthetase)